MSVEDTVKRLREESYETCPCEDCTLKLEAAALLESEHQARVRAEEALRNLLKQTEKHVFGDECIAERNAARAALSSNEPSREEEGK